MPGEHRLVAWLKIKQKDALKLMCVCVSDRAMTPSLPRQRWKTPRGKEYVIAFQMAMDKDHDFEPLTSNFGDMFQFHSLLESLFCFKCVETEKLPRRSTMQSLLNGH